MKLRGEPRIGHRMDPVVRDVRPVAKLIVKTNAVVVQRRAGEHVHGAAKVRFVLERIPRSPPGRPLTSWSRPKQVQLFRDIASAADGGDVLGEEHLDGAIGCGASRQHDANRRLRMLFRDQQP